VRAWRMTSFIGAVSGWGRGKGEEMSELVVVPTRVAMVVRGLTFSGVAVIFVSVGFATGYYKTYPWHDLAAICFGWYCGASAVRKMLNNSVQKEKGI
jgi:hypothetical protein